METAKRMVLVDEKLLENLYRKQETNWKRPIESKVKSILNSELKTDLDDSSLPNDIKVKTYQRHLNRFLHTSHKQTENPIAEVKPEPVQKEPTKPSKSKRKRKNTQIETIKKSPRVKRLGKKPLKLRWLPL
jgi:hypothetical protein